MVDELSRDSLQGGVKTKNLIYVQRPCPNGTNVYQRGSSRNAKGIHILRATDKKYLLFDSNWVWRTTYWIGIKCVLKRKQYSVSYSFCAHVRWRFYSHCVSPSWHAGWTTLWKSNWEVPRQAWRCRCNESLKRRRKLQINIRISKSRLCNQCNEK